MTADANAEKLVADFQALVKDAEALLKATAGLAGDKVQEVRARAEETIKQARSRLQTAEDDAVERVKDVAKVADGFVRDNPWQAIGVAAGIGLILGLLVSKRS